MKISLLEPGKVYHIYNRARNGDRLFADEEDLRSFLRLYQAHVAQVAETYAWCLLPDHLHLLLRIREGAEGSLYKPFAVLFNGYSKAYNRRHGREGRLFMFKLKRMEIRRPSYQADLVRYINQNALRHGAASEITAYRYSSYRSTVSPVGSLVSREALERLFGKGRNLAGALAEPVNETVLKCFMLED